MKLKSLFSILAVSSILFTSCNQDDDFAGVTPSPEERGTGSVTVVLKDSPSSYSGNTQTGTTEENKITSLEFYIFDKAGNRDTKTEFGYAKFSKANKYTFGVTASGSDNSTTILVAVNMNLGTLEGKTLPQVRETLSGIEIKPLNIPENGIPMAGELSNIIIADEEVKDVDIAVNRLYTKLNAPKTDNETKVVLEAADKEELAELLELPEGVTITGEINFNLKGYVVVNGLKKSYAFPNYGTSEADKWVSSVWTLGNTLSNYTASEYENNQLGKVYSGNSFLTSGSVFVYENCPAGYIAEGMTKYNPATVYALIIEAELEAAGKKVTRYWRINVAKTDEKETIYKILRNAIYNVNIKNVKTLGYGTPGEAEGEKPEIPGAKETGVEVKITVADWRVFDEDRDI